MKKIIAAASLFALIALAGCDRQSTGGGTSDTSSQRKASEKTSQQFVLVSTVKDAAEGLKGIAVAENLLYAAGAKSVNVWSANGKLMRSWNISAPATCIAVDGKQSVQVGEKNKVEVFDSTGNLLRTWGKEGKGPGEFRHITGIATWKAFVFVADAGNRRIHHFDETGDFINDIGARDESLGQTGLICPSPYLDVAVAQDGKSIIVGNPGMTRVERYAPDGRLLSYWGDGGNEPEQFCGCCNPTNVALFADGRIATAEKVHPRVKIYDSKGKMLAFLGSENFGTDAAGLDLAVDSQERLWVMDPQKQSIYLYEIKPR